MTTKTPAVIALLLLLAGTLTASPAESRELVPAECGRTADDIADQDVTLMAYLNAVVRNCPVDVPPVPPLPAQCPTGTVGAAGTCVNIRSLPSVKQCPPGKTGVITDGAAVCVPFTPQPVNPPGVSPCPDGYQGAYVGNTGHCVGNDELLGLLGQIPDVPEVPDVPRPPGQVQAPPPGSDCEDYDNEDGFGGTRVTCDYDCFNGEVLAVWVESHDDEYQVPKVSGETTCGGTHAKCGPQQATCTGNSNELTSERQKDAECFGRSHETFDSGVTVACYSVGACTLLFLVCESAGLSVAAARSLCLLQDVDLSGDAAAVDALLARVPDMPLTSVTLFEARGNSGFVVQYVAERPGEPASCRGGPFVLS